MLLYCQTLLGCHNIFHASSLPRKFPLFHVALAGLWFPKTACTRIISAAGILQVELSPEALGVTVIVPASWCLSTTAFTQTQSHCGTTYKFSYRFAVCHCMTVITRGKTQTTANGRSAAVGLAAECYIRARTLDWHQKPWRKQIETPRTDAIWDTVLLTSALKLKLANLCKLSLLKGIWKDPDWS